MQIFKFFFILNLLYDDKHLQRTIGAKYGKINLLHAEKWSHMVPSRVKWRLSWIYANEHKNAMLQLFFLY